MFRVCKYTLVFPSLSQFQTISKNFSKILLGCNPSAICHSKDV
jgi:hypothetical protein